MTIDYGAYGFGRKVPYPYDEAVEKTKAALKTVGFGVLTEIDVKKTMKEKLNADFRRYTILGACNPPSAHKALIDRPRDRPAAAVQRRRLRRGRGIGRADHGSAGRARHRQDRVAGAARRGHPIPTGAGAGRARLSPAKHARRPAILAPVDPKSANGATIATAQVGRRRRHSASAMLDTALWRTL